ncbi:MAG TPA: energy-coupling factor transporter transmembrane component T [Methanospirillum sp.]|uniref:energy-coupling factor transporter transmembrane component T family protein n=1 Tax=Methanospirillum sp. TaxID=45200 RepID=UPI002C6ADFE7|nr:energy-coupling factor transporter transmembrane component T [Methanospirillum sp.]HOJ96029.1 energy-coupling factor transporter transmembrane component T [Methanospirillum sp.]HOL40521.1 energy-coupling factor transporter transmembrane component T [Methanospirillum sp.]
MIEDLFDLEQVTSRTSLIHSLDARVKIIICIAAIVALVAVPYSPVVYTVSAIFFVLFLVLWILSGIPVMVYIRRLFIALPFGFMLCGFQIFFKNRYYTDYHTLLELPFGIQVFYESVQFATILLVKFLVCYSFIVLLSSTSSLQDLLEAAGRLKAPPELILALGMMIRYLFVFGTIYRKVTDALKARLFDPFDHRLPYRYRIVNMGYMMGSLFIRSLEQGERTYASMLCRGYGRDSYIFIRDKPLHRSDLIFLFSCLFIIILVPLFCWYDPYALMDHTIFG